MNNNELYHYGVPGMRWGHRKAATSSSNTSRRTKSETAKTTTNNKHLSKKTKIAIGSTVAVAALAGVGAMLYRDATVEKTRTLAIGKAMVDNMW